MKYARIIEDVAIDVVATDPAELFHPQIAAEFETVPNTVNPGDRRVDGAWVTPDPGPVVEVYVPIQLAIIDMLRLFTTNELAGFNALRKACQALTSEDYLAAAAGDQAKAALVGFEVGLTHYDALRAGMIELNHPQTVQWLSLLVPLGILSAERLGQVLTNVPPAP